MSNHKKSFWQRLLRLLPTEQHHYEDLDFFHLAQCDKVIITTNLDEKIKHIEDKQTIQALVEKFKQHSMNWYVPLEGIPVARLRLNFYQGERPLGNWGIEEQFFTTHQFGSFWFKEVGKEESAAILEILDLADYYQTAP